MSEEQLHYTDLGNAKRLVRDHGGDLRYCAPQRRWYAWDGRRWVPDATGEVMRRAKATVRMIHREAVVLMKQAADALEDAAALNDPRERKEAVGLANALDKAARKHARHALWSEGRGRLEAMVALAQSEPPLPILPEQLDARPWVLNCQNGSLDLRTGALSEHRREDLVTKITPTEYDPGARDERWTQFVEQVMPDPNVRRFVQKALGYSVTGEPSEGKAFLPYGPTHTGKTTILETALAGVGGYGLAMDVETLTGSGKNRDGGRPRFDLVRLMGARLVISTEVPANVQLDAALFKKLTGGDTLLARNLYARDGQESKPTFTIWVGSNHRPHVRDDDDAVWERVQQIPFDQQHVGTARDKTLKPHLETEARRAVLAWLVAGARAYADEGLDAPEAVTTLTEDYRREMNPLTRWVDECCVLREDAATAKVMLRASYDDFTPMRERVGSRRFSNSLAGLSGVSYDRDHRIWRGIAVEEHPEETELSPQELLKFREIADGLGGE